MPFYQLDPLLVCSSAATQGKFLLFFFSDLLVDKSFLFQSIQWKFKFLFLHPRKICWGIFASLESQLILVEGPQKFPILDERPLESYFTFSQNIQKFYWNGLRDVWKVSYSGNISVSSTYTFYQKSVEMSLLMDKNPLKFPVTWSPRKFNWNWLRPRKLPWF